jgi:hypothetical protein
MRTINLRNLLNSYKEIQIDQNAIIFQNKRFGETKIPISSIDSISVEPATVDFVLLSLLSIGGPIVTLMSISAIENGFEAIISNFVLPSVVVLGVTGVLSWLISNYFFAEIVINTQNTTVKVYGSKSKISKISESL